MSVFLYLKNPQDNFYKTALLQLVYKKNTLWYKVFLCTILNISLLFAFLISSPYSFYEDTSIEKKGIDIQIVFDLSISMLAEDLRPNRMEIAKSVVAHFVWQLENDRVWLILFSGRPFQSIPLNDDYDFIRKFIWNISIETINQRYKFLQGTAIWDALILGADTLLSEENEREKVIILLSDGTANVWLEPIIALEYLKEAWIKVYSVGIGTKQINYIDRQITSKVTEKKEIEWVDEVLLTKIAAESGGKYFRAESAKWFHEIFNEINSLERKNARYEYVSVTQPRDAVFLWILFLHFMVLLYILYKKKVSF